MVLRRVDILGQPLHSINATMGEGMTTVDVVEGVGIVGGSRSGSNIRLRGERRLCILGTGIEYIRRMIDFFVAVGRQVGR